MAFSSAPIHILVLPEWRLPDGGLFVQLFPCEVLQWTATQLRQPLGGRELEEEQRAAVGGRAGLRREKALFAE